MTGEENFITAITFPEKKYGMLNPITFIKGEITFK